MRQMSHTKALLEQELMARPDRKTGQLTRREREIMNAVFALGNRVSAEEIRARLSSAPGDSAVRVMLTRLEKKGLLKHRQKGLRYLYSATISPSSARRAALRQYLHTFFGGSAKEMMTTLVSEAAWTDKELDALQDEIERVRKERKEQP